MAADFPGAIPAIVTAGPTTTLSAAGHATALHQKDRDEIRALGTKVGLGTGSGGTASGTPATGTVLVGIGAGVSAWQPITAGLLAGNGTANTVYGPSGYTTTPTVGTLGVTGTAVITGAVTGASGVNVGSATGAGVGQIKTSSHIYVAGGLNVGTATSATAAGNAALSGSVTVSGGININTTGAAAGELKTAGRILAEGDIIGRAGGLTVSQSATATAIAADGEILTSHRILAGGPIYAGVPSGGTTQTNLGITNLVNIGTLATGATDNVDTKSGLYLVYSHSQGGFCAFVGNAPQVVVQLAARTSSDQFDFSTTEPATAAYRIWIFASYLGTMPNVTGTIQFKNRDNGSPLRSHVYSVQKWGLP